MTFFAPLFLLGSISVLIPLYVHLRNRQSRLTYAFPTLRFLMAARPVSHRLRTLMRWLVLSLRILALAGLILAFARPQLWMVTPPQGQARVLVLDISASMAGGTAWNEAKTAADAFLRKHDAPDIRIAMVLMGDSPRAVTSFGDPVPLQCGVLAQLKPTFEATNPEAAIRYADRLLAEQNTAKREITVISDLAASSFKHLEWDRPLSAGVTITALPVAANPPGNVGITAVTAPRAFWNITTPLGILATLHNYGATPASVDVSCFSGQAIVATQHLTLQPRESRELSMEFTPGELKPIRGRIAILTNDGLAADNERFFVVLPQMPTRIARLAPAAAEADTFLRAAIEPLADAAANRYRWLTPASLKDLYARPISKTADVLVMDQGIRRSDTEADAIGTFLNEGGAGILFLSPDKPLTEWEKKLLPLLNLGPERTAAPLSPESHFGEVNFRHPILRSFAQPKAGDLFRISVLHYRNYSIRDDQPLIQLTGGDPILSVMAIGKGRLIICAMPMERSATDWPVQSTFLPMLHETLKWLEASTVQATSTRIGDALADGKLIDHPGFYGSDDAPATLVAANLDPEEGDLARWTLLTAFDRLVSTDKEAPTQAITIANIHRQSTMAWWLLLGVTAFAVLELFIANRTPR